MTTDRTANMLELTRMYALLEDVDGTYPPHFINGVYGRITQLLLEGLIDHAKRAERFLQETNQLTGRRAYLALRTDLAAVSDCFEQVYGVKWVNDQLSLDFDAGSDTSVA